MEAGNTEGPSHDQGGLHRRPAVPNGTPNHRGSQHSRTKGALRLSPENRRQCTLRIEALRQKMPPP
jgi:hypothetical protein